MSPKYFVVLFITAIFLCVGCSKNDDSSTNSFEGEYLGTYSYAYHSVDSTEDFNKYYSSPVWKSCEATIKIIKETDDKLQMQCISALRSFDEIYSYSISEDGVIECKGGRANSNIYIKNGKFSYSYNAYDWSDISLGKGHGFIERLSIQAFKK